MKHFALIFLIASASISIAHAASWWPFGESEEKAEQVEIKQKKDEGTEGMTKAQRLRKAIKSQTFKKGMDIECTEQLRKERWCE